MILEQRKGAKMAGRISRTLISSTDVSGSATFYAEDFGSIGIGLVATTTATYTVKLYITPDTTEPLAFTYKSQAVAGAVEVFENVADSNGTPYSFYKVVISYAGLTGGGTFYASTTAI